MEDGVESLRDNILSTVKELDKRGILQSIASKNLHEIAIEKLKSFSVDEYFLYPQINWNAKSASIQYIAKQLNIGLDTIAFIDDQPFELEEVKYNCPNVRCYEVSVLNKLLDLPEMIPPIVTADSKERRNMYIQDIIRKQAEDQFEGPQQEFLETLDMKVRISKVMAEDLPRCEELTIRTHQLNTTGYTYSYEELEAFSVSPNHRLYMVELNDKFGGYGKIGLTLLECSDSVWEIKLLLMSCRVMNRGIGTILITFIKHLARKTGVRLFAEFISNDRNRMMLVTYKFSGFKELSQNGDVIVLEADLTSVPSYPSYAGIEID